MIVDTSAIVAIVLDEPGTDRLLAALADTDNPKMSAPTAVEISAVLMRRLRPEDRRRVEQLIAVWGIEVVPFDAEQAAVASAAYRDFGRGSGHPAKLNLGDCFSYALARVTGEQLLYVGEEFGHTDVRSTLS